MFYGHRYFKLKVAGRIEEDISRLSAIAAVIDRSEAPYRATLVRTIYEDAERVYGKDKAKKGYKAAQQQVFKSDLSALNAPDVAGKLPKV